MESPAQGSNKQVLGLIRGKLYTVEIRSSRNCHSTVIVILRLTFNPSL